MNQRIVILTACLLLCVQANSSAAEPNILFNLADDPGEKSNLQQEYPEVVARLTSEMQRIIADGRSTPGAKQSNDVNIQLFKKPIPSPKRTK